MGQAFLGGDVRRLAASSRLRSTVAASDSRGRVSLWDLSDPAHPQASLLPGRDGKSILLAFAPTGATLMAVSANGTIHRWDVASHQNLPTLDLGDVRGGVPWKPGRPKLSAAELADDVYGPAGRLTVATADGGAVAIDLATMRGRTIIRAGAIDAPATSIATSPAEDFGLVIGTSQGTRWWNATTHKLVASDRGIPVRGVALGDDYVFTVGPQGVERTPVADGPFSSQSTPSGPSVRSLAKTPNGVVTAEADGTIELLADPTAGIERRPGPATAVIATGPHGRLLVSDGADPSHVDHLAAVPLDRSRPDPYDWGRALRTYRPSPRWWHQSDDESTHWFVSGALITDRFVVAAGQDPARVAVALVWDAKTGRPIKRLPLTTGGVQTTDPSIVTGLSLTHDGALLAAYNPVQESFAFYSTKDWQRTATVYVGQVDDFSTSPDGKTLVVAVGAENGVSSTTAKTALKFIDMRRYRVTRTIQTRGDHAVAFSPDGRSLATLVKGSLRLISTDGRHKLSKPVHIESGSPSGLAWRPDSKLIAVARNARQGTIIVNPQSGEMSRPLSAPLGAATASLEWSDDGARLVAANLEEGATPPAAARPNLWDLSSRNLRKRMCALGARTPSRSEWRLAGRRVPPKALCPRVSPSTKPRTDHVRQPVVAYRSGGQLYAAEATGKRESIDRISRTAFPQPGFAWSPRGALGWVQGGRAHVLRSGRIRSWDCPCASVTFDGEVLEAVDTDAHGLLRFTNHGTARRPVSRLPRYEPQLLAVRRDVAIVAGFSKSPDRATPTELWTVARGRRARRFGVARMGALDRPPVISPDRRTLALSLGASSGACYTVDSLALIRLPRLSVMFPKMPKAQSFSRQVRSVSWTRAGDLQAVIAPLGCSNFKSPPKTEPPGQVLTLQGRTMKATGDTAYDRQAGDGVIASVIGPLPRGASRGTLRIRKSQGSKTIARDADAVSVRP